MCVFQSQTLPVIIFLFLVVDAIRRRSKRAQSKAHGVADTWELLKTGKRALKPKRSGGGAIQAKIVHETRPATSRQCDESSPIRSSTVQTVNE